MKIPETIIRLLEQVIKNQRVIEHRIASCKFGKPTVPGSVLRGNYHIAPTNLGIPVDNRRPIIALNAAGKQPVVPVRSEYVQKRDVFDGFYFPNANEAFPSELDKFPYDPYGTGNFYFGGENPYVENSFPNELDKFNYEGNFPGDGAIFFLNDRR
jgi:hypothetical protein